MSNPTTGAPTTAQLRQNFLAVATERSQVLPRQNYADGATLSFDLPKAGFANYVMLDFQGQIAVTGSGGSIAFSPKAPYNLLQRVTLEDYLGTTRISCGGYSLYQREIATKYAFDPSVSPETQGYSNTLIQQSLGGGNGAAGTYPLNFTVIVPISLHENSTEGSMVMTLPNGQNTLSVSFNSPVKGSTTDNVIKETTAGFTTTVTGTIGATYYYWDVPQGTPLPTDDFALIHELREVMDATNLQPGLEKRYALPTGRTYAMIIQDIILNDTFDTTDVSRIKFMVDGNTPTMDEPNFPYLTRTRRKYGRDLPVGMFLFDFWRKNWSPSDYGSLETSLTLSSTATTTGNTKTKILMESLYRSSAIVTQG